MVGLSVVSAQQVNLASARTTRQTVLMAPTLLKAGFTASSALLVMNADLKLSLRSAILATTHMETR